MRVEAAPINPSDLGTLFAGADIGSGPADRHGRRPAHHGRDSAGTARAAEGAHRQAAPGRQRGGRHRRGGGREGAAPARPARRPAPTARCMRSTVSHRPSSRCRAAGGHDPGRGRLVLRESADGTGMVETMRLEGHSALVHTAAASNLGQMLVKLCLADGVPLVNIVRKPEPGRPAAQARRRARLQLQRPELRGRSHRCARRDRRDARLRRHRRRHARRARSSACMERGAQPERQGLQPLRLDDPQAGVHLRRPRPLADAASSRNFGMAWGMGGWLLTPFLQKLDVAGSQQLLRTRGGGAQDHLRESLHEGGLARGTARRGHAHRLRQAGHRREGPGPAQREDDDALR